jgi:hypothetical protein
MARARLEPPGDPSGYVDFPTARLDEGSHVFRAHDTGADPWHLSSHGRFGLRGDHGTCYVGDDCAVAVRERLGAHLGVVPHAVAVRFEVTELRTLRAWSCADVAHEDAARFGVTRALQSSDPVNVADRGRSHDEYDLVPKWARCLFQAGFEGIRYGSTFAPAYRPNAWALFFARAEERPVATVRTMPAEVAALAADLKLEPRSRRLDDFTVQDFPAG